MLYRGIAEAAIILQLVVSLKGDCEDPCFLHC